MKIAGIELRYLVNGLSEGTKGYYVSNIYGISKDSLLFKLHHPENPDIMLMFSTFGLWASSVKIRQIEENKLLRRFRKDLLRLKLEGIEHPGTERIAYLRFRGFDRAFVLVGEFFGDGNMVLCNEDMKILALLHSLDVRHRELRVGLTYKPPPENNLDVFGITHAELDSHRVPDITSDRWLGRTLGLPARYVGTILHNAQIDTRTMCSDLSEDDLKSIVASTGELVSRVTDGRHSPVIVDGGGGPEVYPVGLLHDGKETAVSSFADGLDDLFTRQIVESGKAVQSQGTEQKIAELETTIGEQDKAVHIVQQKSRGISALAKSLLGLVSCGAASFGDSRVAGALAENNSDHTVEKGVPLIRVQGEKVRINPESSLHAIASGLFDEAKKQSHAVPEIERQRKKTQRQLDELKTKSQKQKETVTFSEVRKKSWYERYRWFFTTDGNLAIGGRDSSSNSSIIRKHMEKNDVIFHADIHGSPFFILKDGADAKPAGLNETAHATVCFSRAWRESMFGLSAYWVGPEQVKKAAPSGQYLPRGSFTIDGQRNYVKIPTLRLGVGIMEQDGARVISCGPPDIIKKNSAYYAVIEPSGMEMTDAAKKLRTEFLKIAGDAAKHVTIDELVRVLPAGKSSIIKTGVGGL